MELFLTDMDYSLEVDSVIQILIAIQTLAINGDLDEIDINEILNLPIGSLIEVSNYLKSKERL